MSRKITTYDTGVSILLGLAAIVCGLLTAVFVHAGRVLVNVNGQTVWTKISGTVLLIVAVLLGVGCVVAFVLTVSQLTEDSPPFKGNK